MLLADPVPDDPAPPLPSGDFDPPLFEDASPESRGGAVSRGRGVLDARPFGFSLAGAEPACEASTVAEVSPVCEPFEDVLTGEVELSPRRNAGASPRCHRRWRR